MKPIGDVIIVRQHMENSPKSSLIVIPDSSNKKSYTGEVVHAGDKASSRPGDTVTFDKWSATEFKLNGEELLILKETNAGIIIRNNTENHD